MQPTLRVTPGPNDPPRLSGAARNALSSWKSGFFDRAKVLAALDEAGRVALLRAGSWVRKVAQQSMRYRKSASAPGQPPSARKGADGSLLRRHLYFAWDDTAKDVVVGPVRLGSSSVPRLHEFGGTLQGVRRKPRSVGEGGPIRIVGEGVWDFGPSTKFVRGDPKHRQVVYARLRTPEMARRATEIENELYAHGDRRYPPRPYMRPALEASSAKIAEFWRDALGRRKGGVA